MKDILLRALVGVGKKALESAVDSVLDDAQEGVRKVDVVITKARAKAKKKPSAERIVVDAEVVEEETKK